MARFARRSGPAIPGRQRVTFVAALTAMVLATVLSVSADEQAVAKVECGPGDGHRAKLALGASDQEVTPCISGTTLDITVPRSCVGTICESKFKVAEIRRHGQETVTYADGSKEKLWHFSFKELRVNKDLSMKTRGGSTADVSITPKGSAQIGGTTTSGDPLYTDMWISSGTFNITITDLPSAFLCTLPIPEDSPLIDLLPGATLRGCGVDLEVKYLVSYDPKGSTTGTYPVRLPNTTLEVTE